MEMVGFVIGLLVGGMLGMFIVCCLVAGNETELQMAQIIETYDNEVNRQYKVIKKTKRQIEILLELALEQDSENVNLIDRLKGILNILQGSDKE